MKNKGMARVEVLERAMKQLIKLLNGPDYYYVKEQVSEQLHSLRESLASVLEKVMETVKQSLVSSTNPLRHLNRKIKSINSKLTQMREILAEESDWNEREQRQATA